MARDFVKLPKVLFKYPLARYPRIITKWYSGKTIEDSRVQWVAPLTGNPDVSLKWMYPRFKIPWDRIMRQEPRPPTALDMNLLFRLFHILERPEQYKNPRKPIHVEGNIIRVSKFSRLLPKTTSDIFSKRARDTYRLW